MTGRGRPRQFSVDEVVDVALELIEEIGVEALSMSVLAKRMGTGSATLYNYVASRDELIDLMLGRSLAEQPEVPLAGGFEDSSEVLVTYMLDHYRAAVARPAVLQLWLQRPSLHLGAMLRGEQELAAIRALGFSADRAAEVYRILASQLVGHITSTAAIGLRPDSLLLNDGSPIAEAQRHLDSLGEERIYESAVRITVAGLMAELHAKNV